MKEPEVKRWTAKRKAELIRQLYRGQTTVSEAARTNDLTQQEIERWLSDAKAGMENALKANPLLSHLTEKKRLKSQQVVTMNVRPNSVKTRRFKPWHILTLSFLRYSNWFPDMNLAVWQKSMMAPGAAML